MPPNTLNLRINPFGVAKVDHLSCFVKRFCSTETKNMGRQRTARAKDKIVRNMGKPLSRKRNRDKRIKEARDDFKQKKEKEIKAHQEYIKSLGQVLEPKPKQTGKVIKKINETFLNRVKRVQDSYDSLIEHADHAQAIIEVLDARDPLSFRFLDIEGETTNNGKPLMFIITKVDLVPASSVQKWVTALTETAPTVAVSLLNPETAAPVIKKMIQEHAPECEAICVIGAPGVGKTTISQLIGSPLVDTDKWEWTICGNSLALANSVEWRGRIRELAENTILRMTTEKIFELVNMKKKGSVGDVLNAFAKQNGIVKTEAPELLMKKIIDGEWKWFGVAPQSENQIEFSQEQINAFSLCSSAQEEEYLQLGPGELVQMDRKALEYEVPQEGSSGSDTEDEDNDEGQDGEQNAQEDQEE